MATRTNFLPCERLLPHRSALLEHLNEIGHAITPENFPGLCDELIFNVLNDSFRRAGAHEGSVWILDPSREYLVNSYNSGPNAAKIVGYKQDLKNGFLSMVFANQQSFAENEIYKNIRHVKDIDNQLQVTTYAMVAVPFFFLKECRGVISCVQLVATKKQGDQLIPVGEVPPGFGPGALSIIQSASLIVRDLVNFHVLRTSVAWT
jgi:hypothetical protein